MAGTQQPPRKSAPGAMTAAMQAVQTVSGPKVLRIGLTQGGQMIEERIIRNRDTVSVGSTEKNTFTIGSPEAPAHFELFQMAGGSYKLNFTDAMEGRVATPQGAKSLRELKESRVATKSNVGWQIPLTDDSRGKITLGDASFLFQFVPLPPAQPRPQLPSAIRAGWVKNIDWTYNACLAGFMVLAFSGVAYVEYLYDPEIEDTFAVDPRLVTLATPPPIEEPPAETAHPDQAPDHPADQPAPRPQAHRDEPHPSAEQQHEAAAQHAQAQAENAARAAQRAADAAIAALQNSASFNALTAVGTGAGNAADRLQQGGLMNGSVAALANAGGVSTARGGSGLTRGGMSASAGGVNGTSLGGGHAIGGAGNDVGSGETVVVERRIVGNASLGEAEATGGEGSLTASQIQAGLRGAASGLRSCYERSLRNNPDLHGRMDISFTIGSAGRITSVSTHGLEGASEVGSCVQGVMRRLVFVAPTGGSVEGSTSVNFAPGG